LTGCATLDLSELEKIESRRIIAERKIEAESHTLEEKAQIFEDRCKDFMKPGTALLPKHRGGEGDLEATLQLLAALSFKYRVNPNPEEYKLANNIVKAIIDLDESNGLDGYVSKNHSNTGDTKRNLYSQLFFAYISAHDAFGGAIGKKIRDHTELIADYVNCNGLVLRNPKGGTVEFSDLKPSKYNLSRSLCLDTLVFIEACNYLGADLEWMEKCVKANYLDRINTLHLNLGVFQLPTHSTDWLNFLRLHTLIEASGSPEYKLALKRLFKSQKKENNPLFNAIYQYHFPESSLQPVIEQYLNSFPLNSGVVCNVDAPRKLFPPITKNHCRAETKEPEPIFSRPLEWYEWKRNPYRVCGRKTAAFSGVDFLIAHHLSQAKPEMKESYSLIVEDRKLTRDRLRDILESEGCEVIQAATIGKAKELLGKYPVTRLLTDLDLSTASGGRTDGLKLVSWLKREQSEGNYQQVQDVTLHSTIFNEGVFNPLKNNIRRKVENMGYKVQPKTDLLR